ncbi:MAG: hypothetical protein H7287_03340 [Thermoleophilia bacterium]|nr:hypothetical protein [Thermoleophilia bacterium]
MLADRTLDTLHPKRLARPLLAVLITCAVAATALPTAALAKVHVKPAKPKHPSRVTSWMPHIGRTIVPTRVDQLGAQIATWYGPGFFGHGTACGGTLQPSTWGIAHRTLPCGTLVTLTNGNRTVTVPVIDRGPFSGATVDLTSRTKTYLGFTSGSIRMAKVARYRLVPLPAPVAGIRPLQ